MPLFFRLYTLLFLCLVGCSGGDADIPFHYKTFPQYDIYGIDISKYQPNMKWDKVARDSLRFAFIKATQGKVGKDPLYQEHWAGAAQQGVVRGAYHFFENTDSIGALRQAQNFIETVELSSGDLPPVLDIERKPFNKTHLRSVKIWLRIIERYYGVRPIIYTGQHFYNKYLSADLHDYPLWIAKYSRSQPVLKRGKRWLFWQYTDQQRNVFTKGNDGKIDLDVFSGSWAELLQLTLP